MAVRAGKMDLLGESKDICHLVDTVEWNYRVQAVSPATNQRGESIFRKRKWNKLTGKEGVTGKYNI